MLEGLGMWVCRAVRGVGLWHWVAGGEFWRAGGCGLSVWACGCSVVVAAGWVVSGGRVAISVMRSLRRACWVVICG